MARPSAASSRIEPSEIPANARPSHSPHARRFSTASRLMRTSRRMSGSASPASSRSSVFEFGLEERPSVRMAARRASRDSALSCMPAAMISSRPRTSASVSFAKAFSISGYIALSAPPASALTEARRSLFSGESRFSTASASPMAPRSRLLATTSSRSAGSGTTAPEMASSAFSPRTMNTCFPEVCISPSASAFSTARAFGSPSATSAAIASMRSSPSPNASFSTAARSSASAGKDMKKAATKSAFFIPERTLHLLVGHQRGLVLLLVVARDERAPRLGLDRPLGLPHYVELAVALHFADEHRLVEVVVLLVHLGGDARRRLEGLARHGRGHGCDVEALRLLHRLLPHVDADVGGFHRVVGERLILVPGDVLGLGIGGPFLGERVVRRGLDRHEVVPRREVADERLGIDAAQLLLAHRERHHRHVGGLQALVAQLLIEGNVRIAIDGGNHGRLAAGGELLDVGDDGLVVAVAERRVDLLDVLVGNALGLEEGAQDLVGGARIDIVGAKQEPALGRAAVLGHQVLDRRDRLLVGRGAGIEHVPGYFLAFVLHRVEEQAV